MMNTLEEFMKRLKSRRPKKEEAIPLKLISRDLIEIAVINAIQPFYSGQEIKRIEIPALTTELVEINLYKEV